MTGFDEVGGVGGGCGGNCDDGGESVVAFLCGAALIPNPTRIVTTVVGRVATVVGVVTGAMGVVAAVGWEAVCEQRRKNNEVTDLNKKVVEL